MKNEYFKLVRTHNHQRDDFEILYCIKKYDNRYIWDSIYHQFLDTPEYTEESYKDPYGSIYHIDLKQMLNIIAPDILDAFKDYLTENNLDLNNDDISIYLASKHDYAKFDKNFANEMAFLEYINSEAAEMDKHRIITKEILYEAGFELQELETNLYKQFLKDNPEYGEVDPEDYVCLRKWTNDDRPLKLDIENRTTNRGTQWYLHIDNSDCNTIGSADIDTVWEFNTLMQVFGNKFRL